jgi:hypothetical protein
MADLKIRWGGATVSPSDVKLRSSGAWVSPSVVYVRASGAWVAVWSSLSLSVSGTALGLSTLATGKTGVVTVTATGGSGSSKTYAWTWVTNPGGLTIDSPSADATQFTKTGMSVGTTYTGTARCTVSDGATTAAIDVSVSVRRTDPNTGL